MKPARGFLLGKFMPLHEGHLFMIRVAAEMVDELSVLVCTRECEPIDGGLRLRWVEESVPRNVRVLHYGEDVPQEPADHPDFWPIWRKIVKETHPEPIDLVFGSEDYVVRLAAEVGATPFPVDPRREVVDVSATMIRENPAAHWEYVPPAVRPYYQRRICLLGPESSGKSTLAGKLATRFATCQVPEFGRTWDEIVRHGEAWSTSDFMAIAEGQVAFRNVIAGWAGPLLIEDTDIIQTLVWAEYFLGAVPKELTAYAAEAGLADHYLLLTPEVDWADDGTRYSGADDIRQWFFDRARAHLAERGCRFDVIGGADWAGRTTAAMTAVTSVNSR